jgi:hypothetical protein
LSPTVLSQKIDRPLAPVTAYWLARDCDGATHDFLAEQNNAAVMDVFARSVCDGFGQRHEPLLIFTRLLDHLKDADPQANELARILTRLSGASGAEGVTLHGLELDRACDPDGCLATVVEEPVQRARRFARSMEAASGRARDWESRPLVLTAGEEGFQEVFLNAVSRRLVSVELPEALLTHGLDPSVARLLDSVRGGLGRLARLGVAPAVPVTASSLGRMAGFIVDRAFALERTRD